MTEARPGPGRPAWADEPAVVAGGYDRDDRLTALRAQVDDIDDRIVELIVRRQRVVDRIRVAKSGRVPARVPDRDRQVLDRVSLRAARLGGDGELVARIYRAVIDAFVAWQQPNR